MKKFTFLALCLLVFACIPPEQPDYSTIKVDLKSDTFIKVEKQKDKTKIDSLVAQLEHENPTNRYLGARAFASIQSPDDIPKLASLLTDPVNEVAQMAAYSIGQQKSVKGEFRLEKAFFRVDTLGNYDEVNMSILEAVGKCGGKDNLLNLANISTYTKRDTSLLLGQALGIYRYMLRDITADEGTAKMIELATDKDLFKKVRIIGANYLARTPFGNIPEELRSKLINSLSETKDPEIRMFLFLAVGKLKTEAAKAKIIEVYEQTGDFREKCNAIRSLSNFDYASVQSIPFKALKDKNLMVKKTAAQFFIENGSPQDGSLYFRMARDEQYNDVKVDLLAAACRNVPPYFKDTHWSIFNTLKNSFNEAKSDLKKADIVRAMGGNVLNYRKIWEFAHVDTLPPVVKTAAVAALRNIYTLPQSKTLLGNRASKEIASFLGEAINNGDVGEVVEAAEIIAANPELSAEFENSSFLYIKQRVLKLPQEIEAHHAIQKAINTFDSVDKPLKALEYNNPIDFEIYNDLYLPITATVQTSRGSFSMKLYPKEAPGTVANFIKLANSGFYNNKFFHRIIPGFVSQAGCERGDGYSAPTFSIRSEFSPLYYNTTGMVGMASAGPNTESAQFFITHGPSPHLDGRYTIFGKVQEGMDIVFELQRGDIIKSVKIEGSTPPPAK